MAPEQARGEIHRVDERADVFALGSILCEVLTGQPAFVGRTPGEIQRKAALGDLTEVVAALASCGADSELIALARDCVAREAEDRPRHAGAVAERITGYRAAVQERLRTAEIARAAEQARALESRRTAEVAEAKAKAERRARRLIGALAATVLGLAVAVGVGYAWLQQQRAERQARVDLAVREVEVLRSAAQQAGDDPTRWTKAVDAARSVERLLADARDELTRKRGAMLVDSVVAEARTAENDRTMLDRLIEIRSGRSDDPDGRATDAAYAAAFREAGIDLVAMPPTEAGAKIRARPATVAVALATGLDDWAGVRRDQRSDRRGAERLAQAARSADPDPWRGGLRDALDSADKPQRLSALHSLARTARFDDLPPVSLNLLGSALRDAGDLQMAESVLRRAQRGHPGDVSLNHDLARCLDRLGRLEEAIRYYTAARAIRAEVAHELAHALQRKGDTDEAIAVFQDLTALRPGIGRHFLCLGRVLQSRGRTPEAGVAFDAAVAASREYVRQKRDEVWSRQYLGEALRFQGRLDEAIAEYKEAIRLQPANTAAHARLGVILSDDKHEYGAAATEFREVIRLEPDDFSAHALLGITLGHLGKADEASAEYREAIRLAPDKYAAHDSLGWALQNQGRLDEAIAEHQEAIRLKPGDDAAHNGLGYALYRKGKLDQAIAEYQEAIRLKPDNTWAHGNLALALHAKGKHTEAAAEFRELIRLQPHNAWAHYRLAWTLAVPADRPRRGYDEALRYAEQAVVLEPNDCDSHNALALAQYRAGHCALAITAAARSIELNKAVDVSNWFILAMAHWQQGDKAEARKWFDKAVAWTEEKDPKNAELRGFWTEVAELMRQPGPAAAVAGSPTAPAVEKPH
jgi:tetratricopeptide (TPR) repeat protein